MKDVKFIIGACKKNRSKFYFQYNNRVYFIIEKNEEQEKVLDRITNVRYAYEKWHTIKQESDDKGKNSMSRDEQSQRLSEITDYSPAEFEYEAQEKLRMEELRAERKKSPRKIEGERYQDRKKNDIRKYEKNLEKKSDNRKKRDGFRQKYKYAEQMQQSKRNPSSGPRK